jgi:tetratricopeptide (TPR) repeat protein
MTLPAPVQVEVYPDHADFEVRAIGLPGLGALGVTFGEVVAMDSPSRRPPGDFHWASTLWHEMSHVYVLTATHHLVPRWFTEGEAVHEETAVAADWGDRMGPDEIAAIRDRKLLPVAELDRGFVRPSYPAQVIVSYFEAGKICDYIAQKWGDDKILQMIHSFAESKSTPEVIQADLGMSPADFDQQFEAWLDAQTKTTVEHFPEWKKRIRTLADDLHDRKYDEAIKEGTAIRDWYPDYVESNSVYELLANAYLEKGNKAAAIQQLEDYSHVGGRNPATIKQLAGLEPNPDAAAKALERLLYIYPEDEKLHSMLGDLLLQKGNTAGAIREYQALLALKPADVAQARFNLAQAYHRANRVEDAKEQVLLALEAAPNFKPAQKLLLEIMK